MRALIIEDELLTAENMATLLRELVPEIRILSILQSVSESVEWFSRNDMPDVVFMDIHLADGSSFSIFDKVDITCPVVFTTAYDEYALRAFDVNSVDYLLKPVSKSSLQRALDKLQRLSGINTAVDNLEFIKKIAVAIRQNSTVYKSSLLVGVKDKLIPLLVKDVAYIHVDGRNCVAVKFDRTETILSHSMDEIMKQLDPKCFFRANRQFIISRTAVQDISLWFGNRIAVNLTIPVPERIIISRTHVQEFKNWLTE